MSDTEAQLVSRAVSGDREALAALLRQYVPMLRRSFSGEIPARWQAILTVDDIIQETYTDVFLDIAQFEQRGEKSFERWLITVARNNLLNAVKMLEAEKRGGGRRRVVESPSKSYAALYELVGATSTTPSRAAADAEAKMALIQALSELPEDYQTVVRQYDLEGRSIEEVSAALGRRPGAVYMLRARAHKALGRLLGDASRFLS